MKKFLVLIITLSIILSCNNLTSSSPENLQQEDFNEVNIDGLYTLSVPKYMKEMNNLNEEASLQYANVFKEAYTVVIHENKDKFINTFKEFGEYNDDLSVVENYSLTHQNFFNEIATVDKIIPYDITTINDLDAKRIKILAKVDGIDITYVISHIEGKENVYQIMSWTLPDKIGKYEDTFIKINNSFKLLK